MKTIILSNLEPLHMPGMNSLVEQKLRKMTDQELLESVLNLADGQYLKVRSGSNVLIDGNTRCLEMLRRMEENPVSLFIPDLEIPIEVIP